jgi:predicted histone-like DNA-binding protein
MVNLKPVSKSNPQDVNAENKFYAQVISQGYTDFERLAYLVSNQCTVRESDCYAVLRALEHNIMDELKQGRIVQLGGLGNLQVSVSSNGEANAEDVSAFSVKKRRIIFRPGMRLKQMLSIVTFKLVG